MRDWPRGSPWQRWPDTLKEHAEGGLISPKGPDSVKPWRRVSDPPFPMRGDRRARRSLKGLRDRGLIQPGLTDDDKPRAARVAAQRTVEIMIDAGSDGLNRQAHRLVCDRSETLEAQDAVGADDIRDLDSEGGGVGDFGGVDDERLESIMAVFVMVIAVIIRAVIVVMMVMMMHFVAGGNVVLRALAAAQQNIGGQRAHGGGDDLHALARF